MNEAPLRELLGELNVEIIQTNANGWLLARCPFAEWLHNRGADQNPDFYVRVEPTGISGFHCFACKTHGRMSTLVRKLEYYRQEKYRGLAVKADLMETPDEFPPYEHDSAIQVEPDPLNKAAYLGMYPLAWEDEWSRKYLAGRGVGKATAELLGLVYDDDECRILFPVLNHKSDLFGFTGRTILEKHQFPFPRYPKVRDYAGLPKERLILGEQLIEKGKPLLLVEGLFALAHMIEIGAREFCNPVATMGSNMSKYQRDILISYNAPIHLLYDNDEAGELGLFGPMNAEGERMGGGAWDKVHEHVPTFLPLYPEGINDPDNLTTEMLQEMLFSDDSLAN